MAKLRSDEEQKAVETILWALGHRLVRLRDEYTMKVMRKEEPEGIVQGLELALSEINQLLPRRKRVRPDRER